ncbi:MAG: hypothetical protein LLG05_02455 [Porphyromonadaceae bacterium]|nr:hypothetical protein [Porphyromonadaceae bacterium]
MNMYLFIELAKRIATSDLKELEKRYESIVNGYSDMFTQIELGMISTRLMELAKEEIEEAKRENERESDDVNNIVWIQVPKGDSMDFWENKYGLRTWTRFFHTVGEGMDYALTAQRSYYWVDRVIVMDANRRVLNDLKFSDFIQHPLYNEWIPIEPKIKITPQTYKEEE